MKTIKINGNYKTRAGLKVNLIGLSSNPTHPVVGDLIDAEGNICLEVWKIDGSYGDIVSSYDLVEVPEKITFSTSCSTPPFDIEVDKLRVCFKKNGITYFIVTHETLEKISEAYEKLS